MLPKVIYVTFPNSSWCLLLRNYQKNFDYRAPEKKRHLLNPQKKTKSLSSPKIGILILRTTLAKMHPNKLLALPAFALLSLAWAQSTITVTTRIISVTTTTIKVSAPAAPTVPNISIAHSSLSNSSCTCVESGAWCGTRSSKQIGLAGTCTSTALYFCKSNGDQNPQAHECKDVLDGAYPGQTAGTAQCLESMFYGIYNDNCILAKNGTEHN
jgi:hypothetical protein